MRMYIYVHNSDLAFTGLIIDVGVLGTLWIDTRVA